MMLSNDASGNLFIASFTGYSTVVLKKHSDELQNEVNILKHKQYCYDKDISLKNYELICTFVDEKK